MRTKKEVLYDLLFLVFGFPLGTLITSFIFFLFWIGVIRVKNFDRARSALSLRNSIGGSLFILGNHPWWAEVFVVPSLVSFPSYLLHPLRDFPWCTPKSSLLKYFPFIYLLRPILMHRNSTGKTRRFMETIARKLHVHKQIVMNFVEGGRTESKSSDAIEQNGKRMRPVRAGYLEIANNKKFCAEADPEKVIALPVWTQVYPKCFFGKIEVRFGEADFIYHFPKEVLQEKLFNL